MSRPGFSTQRIAAALLVCLLAVVVILSVLSASQPTTTSVGTNASERYTAIDGVEATVTVTIQRGNRTNRTVGHVTLRPSDDQLRLETRNQSTVGPELVVSNGSVRWAYDRDNRTVRRTTVPSDRDRIANQGDRIESLFQQAQANRSAGATESFADQEIEPLPVVPGTPSAPSQSTVVGTNLTGATDVSYEGTATLDGRQVHILEITGRTDTEESYRNFSQRLWIDAEWYFPLQYRTTWMENGDSVTAVVRYANVSFNPDISEETFSFDRPADAAIVGPELGANASERLDDVETVSATRTSRISGYSFNSTGNDTYRSTQYVQRRLETGEYRTEIRNTSMDRAADLVVSNGTVTWRYDRDANNVTVFETNGYRATAARGNQIERLFARLNWTRTSVGAEQAGTPGAGIEPSPGLTTADQLESSLSRTQPNRYGVTFGGVELVDGRPAYVLTISPSVGGSNASDGSRNYSQTMWIDSEYFFTLQQRTQFSADGNEITSVTTYSNISFNREFDDETFDFDPPANATVSEPISSASTTYDSRAAVERNTTLPVPEPSTPDGFEFAQGRISSFNDSSAVRLVYTNETIRLSVGVYAFNQSLGGNESSNAGETVRVGNRTATYSEVGPYRSVSWTVDGFGFTVSGNGASRSLLIEVASSMVE
jgi:outer membrane lipoprotein-sorting protein